MQFSECQKYFDGLMKSYVASATVIKGKMDSQAIRFYIKNALSAHCQVVWDKNDNLFMLCPHNRRFGKMILEIDPDGKIVPICSDIPASEVKKWDSLEIRGSKYEVSRLFSGTYVRLYYSSAATSSYKDQWNVALENHISLDKVADRQSLSSKGKTYMGAEIERLLKNVSFDSLDKGKTHIYLLYSPALIEDIYYGEYDMVEHFAEIDHESGHVDFKQVALEPESEMCGIIIGAAVMYKESHLLQRQMTNGFKNLNYILLRNLSNEQFYSYFPIEEWKGGRTKVLEKITKHSNYMAKNINDYKFIKLKLKEKKIKATQSNVYDILISLPTNELATYLNIRIY